jgi:drug/metabolite transporter (DMT)-like permease
VLLHETLHWYEPVGGVVVLAGVTLTQWGVTRRRRSSTAAARVPVRSAAR